MVDELNKKLIELKPHVITSDRKEAIELFKHNNTVVHRYLVGNGRVYEVALAYYKFFSEKVEGRKREVEELLKSKS